jgi:GNAT superfamily N-acetyltransferase
VKLRPEDLDGYLTCAGASPDRFEAIRRSYEDGRRAYANTMLAKDAAGTVVGVVTVNEPADGSTLMVAYGAPTPELAREALDRARKLGARRVGLRLTDPPAAFRTALLEVGFVDHGERVEFKIPVEELPDDEGSPLAWRIAGEDGAAMLAAVAEGDPHGKDERDAPAEMLGSFGRMRNDPACFQIGSLDGEDVAFVCAQVAAKDGWSRIAYMGLVPAARGQGLGRWLHRHGFAMIKEQGGKLYHGGTAASNKAMLALFEAHGCREFKRMTEFTWHG